MTVPRRLAMSRLKGSNLHARSYEANRLPVRVVTRATAFGNPFKYVRDERCMVLTTTEGAEVVALYRRWLCDDPSGRAVAHRIRQELPGHNVACFCRLCPRHVMGLPLGEACRDCAPCHGDPILQVAAGRRWSDYIGAWVAISG